MKKMKRIQLPLLLPSILLVLLAASTLALTPLAGDIFENYDDSIRANENFDFVIVGSGPAGAVLAERLSQKKTFKVLLLEAGGTDNYLEVRAPTMFSALYEPQSANYEQTSWGYTNEQPEFLQRGRTMLLPRIKLFGGCSAGNTMAEYRGDYRDFDVDWFTNLGLKSMNWTSMLPYFKKTERNLFTTGVNPSLHGYDGEWPIGPQSYTHPISYEFLNYLNQSLGFPLETDPNDGTPIGVTLTPVNIVNGTRVTVANAMIDQTTLARNNLVVKLNAQVTKVVFNHKKEATGVIYKDLITGAMVQVDAKKEVILSAGTYNTPQLLLLSGVGPATELAAMNITVVANVPGVGKGLADHLLIGVAVNTTGVQTIESTFDTDETLLAALDELVNEGSGPLASNIGEVYAGANTGVDNSTYPVDKPDVIFEMGPVLFALDGLLAIPGVHAMSAGPDLMAVTSRGYVKLRSANPFDKPIINHQYLSSQTEIDRVIAGLRTMRQALRGLLGNRFVNEILPGDNVNSREEFVEYIFNYAMTGYHPCCAARMGNVSHPPIRDDDLAVVDESYNVRGVKNLRVVDASSMPSLTTGNIQWPIVALAERAAEIIAKENGASGKFTNKSLARRVLKLIQKDNKKKTYGDAFTYLKKKYQKKHD